MLLGFAGTVLKVALDHKTFYKTLDIRVLITAVNDILSDTNLFEVLLARVVMVCINDDRGIDKIGFLVKFFYTEKILPSLVTSQPR